MSSSNEHDQKEECATITKLRVMLAESERKCQEAHVDAAKWLAMSETITESFHNELYGERVRFEQKIKLLKESEEDFCSETARTQRERNDTVRYLMKWLIFLNIQLFLGFVVTFTLNHASPEIHQWLLFSRLFQFLLVMLDSLRIASIVIFTACLTLNKTLYGRAIRKASV